MWHFVKGLTDHYIKYLKQYHEIGALIVTSSCGVWGSEKLRILCKKFVIGNAYFTKEERSQINTLTLQLKELDKEEQNKLKASRRKGRKKIRMEINKIQNEKPVVKINETKSWFIKKA